jgi:hypothetical protein
VPSQYPQKLGGGDHHRHRQQSLPEGSDAHG